MNISELLAKVDASLYSAFFYTPSYYENSKSYLFINPFEIISANNLSEIKSALKKVDDLIDAGMQGYCTINYEAGFAFEEKLRKIYKENNNELLRFSFFKPENIFIYDSSEIVFDEIESDDFQLQDFSLNISKEDFISNIQKIKNYIEEGDTYQVNHTAKGKFNFKGNLSSLFQKLLFNQSASYSAFINSGERTIISISPELFFQIDRNKIITRPMKGTIGRGKYFSEDEANYSRLRESKKDRAENLMIVDLLRNDLGRISNYGSVKVNNLYNIEKYESLFQMTSEIESALIENLKFSTIIENIFPSGSITGAPKIRTMEIINELEKEKRGIYTGSIGIIKKDEIVFNVAIRTIDLDRYSGDGEIGLGSGIVWDSDPEKEYSETLLKSNFLLSPSPYFELIETMKVENRAVELLDEHLTRLKDAANYFIFSFNEKKTTESIKRLSKSLSKNKIYKIRLLLNKWGSIKLNVEEITLAKNKLKVMLSKNNISSENRFQYFKTTNRKLYREEYEYYNSKGFDEVIYLNEKGQVAEGAVSNIFIKKDGKYYTPPIESGILNGIYRDKFINFNNVTEKFIYLEDLDSAEEIILTNAVRGEQVVEQVYKNEDE